MKLSKMIVPKLPRARIYSLKKVSFLSVSNSLKFLKFVTLAS